MTDGVTRVRYTRALGSVKMSFSDCRGISIGLVSKR